jgi:hypothetical protein
VIPSNGHSSPPEAITDIANESDPYQAIGPETVRNLHRTGAGQRADLLPAKLLHGSSNVLSITVAIESG